MFGADKGNVAAQDNRLNGKKLKIGIVQARFNANITDALAAACKAELLALGVKAIKIEGRQRSAAYVEQVTRVWRAAIDQACAPGGRYSVQAGWSAALARHAEGQQHTLGAYDRPWR